MSKIKNYFYIITTDLKSFFYITPMKMQAPVISYDEFLYACIVEICCQSTEPVFNRLLHFFIATNALLHANGLYFLNNPHIFNTVSAKRKKFPPTKKLLYLTACEICWQFISTTQARNMQRKYFPIFHILRFSYIYTIYTWKINISFNLIWWFGYSTGFKAGTLGLSISHCFWCRYSISWCWQKYSCFHGFLL
jgi:hypothetical protein